MKIATLVLAATILLPASLFSRAPQRDVPAEVESARGALRGAYNDLDHAGGQWGGRRRARIT